MTLDLSKLDALDKKEIDVLISALDDAREAMNYSNFHWNKFDRIKQLLRSLKRPAVRRRLEAPSEGEIALAVAEACLDQHRRGEIRYVPSLPVITAIARAALLAAERVRGTSSDTAENHLGAISTSVRDEG